MNEPLCKMKTLALLNSKPTASVDPEGGGVLSPNPSENSQNIAFLEIQVRIP